MTSIFFRWVGSTLVQPPSRFERYDFPGELEAPASQLSVTTCFRQLSGGVVDGFILPIVTPTYNWG